ncbi:MAG TPA: HD domain-containing protein, partial [Flavobacteriales bacterium]|nr:HD domain-containing protein [Flavobacteriales bacterium]
QPSQQRLKAGNACPGSFHYLGAVDPMDHQGAQRFILTELHAGLPDFRTYHSLEHTLDVHDSAVRLAEQEGISGDELVLLKTAALFHDAGFMVMPHKHEQGSCLLAREHLPRFGYDAQAVERICHTIMCTVVPQVADDVLSKVLCDADLDYLGRDDFFTIGDRLYEELRAEGALASRREWNQRQEAFIAKHRYYTATSRLLREARKQQHLETIRQQLGQEG